MNNEIVIVINPGSLSTKIAFFNRTHQLESVTIEHRQSELDKYDRITDQVDFRYQAVLQEVAAFLAHGLYTVVGVVGRGGIVRPLEGGTYRINDAFLQDASSGTYGEHASNLGCLIADRLKDEFGLDNCYTVDPVSCSNISNVAEISGVPGIIRNGRGHPLNIRMTARKIALLQNTPFEQSCYVVAHLGGGISIALVEGGRLTDINDALLGMGPFSPNRAGALPLRGVIKLCRELGFEKTEILLSKNSGLKAYLGTEDLREVLKMVDQEDIQADLVYRAFVYQIAKEIGACYAASKAKAQAIIITGGIAYNERFIADLKEYVGTLTEFHVYPGSNEMEALAEGIFRVIDGVEEAKEY
jgi:butyrate kinase